MQFLQLPRCDSSSKTQSIDIDMTSPFFIVGSGRSGSTLLRVLLCAHSKVTIPPETYFIMPLVNQLPINAGLNRNQTDQAIDIITSHYRWPDMGMTRDYLVDQVADMDSPLLSDIINVIYHFHLLKDNKQIWGDKTPPYISIVPELKELYPKAKIIHLVRDGRDVTRSFRVTGWYGPWIKDNSKEWRDAIGHYNRYKRARPDIGIYEIRYENLVMETEKTIRDLCGFLGITYEAGMLDWMPAIQGKIPTREAHIHKKLGKKPGIEDIYRWKSEMTKREVFITESFIWKELRSAGYELYFSNKSWKPVFSASRLCNYMAIPASSFLVRIERFMSRKLWGKEH
jgi:hypothetical protein